MSALKERLRPAKFLNMLSCDPSLIQLVLHDGSSTESSRTSRGFLHEELGRFRNSWPNIIRFPTWFTSSPNIERYFYSATTFLLSCIFLLPLQNGMTKRTASMMIWLIARKEFFAVLYTRAHPIFSYAVLFCAWDHFAKWRLFLYCDIKRGRAHWQVDDGSRHFYSASCQSCLFESICQVTYHLFNVIRARGKLAS